MLIAPLPPQGLEFTALEKMKREIGVGIGNV